VFYPLGTGDKWQYVLADPQFPNVFWNVSVVSDTLMPNGLHYASVAGLSPTFQRQDGNRVYTYARNHQQDILLYDFERPEGDTIVTCIDYDTVDVILKHSHPPGIIFGRMLRSWTFQHKYRHVIDANSERRIIDSLGLVSYTDGIGTPFSLRGAVISGQSFGTMTGVGETPPLVPCSPHLAQNYPNPFNPQTCIRFTLNARAWTTLEVFDLLGRKISVLLNEMVDAGDHQVTFHSNGLPSGLYLYRLSVDHLSRSRTMVLLK
jgi:hypothetical protein